MHNKLKQQRRMRKLREAVNTAQLHSLAVSKSCRVDNSSNNDKKTHFKAVTVFFTFVLCGVVGFNSSTVVSMTSKAKAKFWKTLKSQTTSTSHQQSVPEKKPRKT